MGVCHFQTESQLGVHVTHVLSGIPGQPKSRRDLVVRNRQALKV